MENTTGRRRKKERGFVTIENSMFEDSRISWKAKGLLGYLLTKPDGWIVRRFDLIKHATDGDKSVRSAIDELKKYGYLTIKRIKKDNGQWAGTVWEYDDIPMFEPLDSETVEKVDEEPQMLEPQGIEPCADFRHMEKGHVENGTHISNTDISNTDISNTDISNTDIKNKHDDDKRISPSAENSAIQNDDEMNLIISNLREVTKEDLTDRSFNSVVRKVVDKQQQGKVKSFRDYLTTALIKKMDELEFRRNQEKAQQEFNEAAKAKRDDRIKNTDTQRPVGFYNWLDERE